MDISKVCRTCLCNESLNPIFLNPGKHESYSTALYIGTGVKISPDDGLPQNMCTSCIDRLNDSMMFRKTCKQVEKELFTVINKFKTEDVSQFVTAPDLNNTHLKIEITLESKLEITKGEFSLQVNDNNFEDNKLLNETVSEEIKPEEQAEYLFEDSGGNAGDLKDTGKCEIVGAKTVEEAPKTSNRVVCLLCQKELSVRSYEDHMAKKHPGADDRKVKCELCDAYLTPAKLNRHNKLVHGLGETLRCGYCKTEFDCRDILIQHVTTCTAKKKRRKIYEAGRALVECDECHKTMQRASLKMHKSVKHAGMGPVCEHCGLRFGNKFRLHEHYRAKHGYEKYKCQYCEFQSAAITAMRNHERRHKGEKPFVCEQCGAKFHAAYLLAQHKQSHRTEKLAKCDLCPASFKARNSLHMHKLTCHSSKLYKCSLCARAYKCRLYARKHVRQAHGQCAPPPIVHSHG